MVEQKRQDVVQIPNAKEYLQKYIDASLAGAQISGALLVGTNRFHRAMRSIGRFLGPESGVRVEGNNPYVIQIGQSQTDTEDRRLRELVAWQVKKEGLVYFLSTSHRQVFQQTLGLIYPLLGVDVCRISLQTQDLKHCLQAVSLRQSETALRVRQYVSKSIIEDPNSRKRVRTHSEYTDEDAQAVFDQLSEQKQWLSSILFEMRGVHVANGRIWRDGSFSCTRGFDAFLQIILSSIQQAIISRYRLFERRDCVSSPTEKPRPLRIVYTNSVFDNKAENRRLLRALDGLRDVAVSVLHPNPYVHASILDYNDGSSCDVWVTDDTSILLIPKYKATAQSLSRICDQINDRFQEGNIMEC
jgi:hypothetical protein